MKKLVNKFAVALWVLALLVFVGECAQILMMLRTANELAGQGDKIYLVQQAFWRSFVAAIVGPAQMAAFGAIIELVDQIRAQQRK